MPKIKNNPILNLFRYMWKYSPQKKWVIIFILFSIIGNLIGLLDALIIGRVFNSIQFSADDPNLLWFLIKNLSLLPLITIGFWIFHGTSRYIENKNAFLVQRTYKNKKFKQVMDLPIQWHKDHHSGDTIDKINKAADNLFAFASEVFVIIEGFVRLLGSILIFILVDYKACLISIFVTIGTIFTMLKFDKILQKGFQKIYKAENYLASAIHDYISNVITIITLRLKKRVTKEIDKRTMKAFDTYNKNSIINETKWCILSLYITFMIIGILVFNAYSSYRKEGVIILGTLFILYKYLEEIQRSFQTFAWFYERIVKRNTAVQAAKIIDEEYTKIKTKTKKYYLPKSWQNIEIQNLSFQYKNDDKQTINHIHNISLNIKRGQKIALIGESGSGKSTIFSLLRGLHKTDQEKTFCDSKKLKNGLAHLYNSVTLIPQDPEIFNSTIEDNITMEINTNKKLLNKMIKIARFEKVLKRLPRGLETNVMEKGVSLSGGEKQRLALARGLLATQNSEFLLLDEPTSSVDSTNELEIYKNIFSYFKDKTIISAIHRLHLLKYFDYIYFFKNGKIIGEGKFESLLKTNKDFQKLWKDYSKSQV